MEPVIATGNINDDAPSNRIMTRQCMVTAAPIGLGHHRLNTTTVDTTVVDKAHSWMSFPRYRDGEKQFIIPAGFGIMHFMILIKRYTGNL